MSSLLSSQLLWECRIGDRLYMLSFSFFFLRKELYIFMKRCQRKKRRECKATIPLPHKCTHREMCRWEHQGSQGLRDFHKTRKVVSYRLRLKSARSSESSITSCLQYDVLKHKPCYKRSIYKSTYQKAFATDWVFLSPSKLTCWKPHLQSNGVWRWGLWEVSWSWGWSPHKWD